MRIHSDAHFFCSIVMSLSFSEFKDSPLALSDHFMVIGNPIAHSLSPLMHNIALKHYDISGIYYAIELSLNEFSGFASHLNLETCRGVNITIPFKSEMIALVDEIDRSAEGIEAINTIYKKNDRLIGANTDVYGFMSPLSIYRDEIAGEKAIVFGSGGASKAIVKALLEMGIEEIVILSRSKTGIDDDQRVIYASYDMFDHHVEESTLIVNATPLGMHPNYSESPLNLNQYHQLNGKICYDIIYNPDKTTFLEHAEKEGAVTINGLDMFIQQGSKSFELWTGKSFPVETVRKELLDALK